MWRGQKIEPRADLPYLRRMNAKRNIFLIGPRACGKTSVGLALAKRLDRGFVDTDHALAKAVGMEIAEYVERNGWDAFRDQEAGILAREAAPGGRVIGCGGGIVLREENRGVLKTGVTLYLKAGPDELARRLESDPVDAQRPSLTGRSIADEVREVLAERAPLYEGCADAVVTGGSVDETVRAALEKLESFPESF